MKITEALLQIMLMPMLMMLDLTLTLLLYAFKVVAYDVVADAIADPKMLNASRHLASAYVAVLLPLLLTMLMLLRPLIRADNRCYNVILKCE